MQPYRTVPGSRRGDNRGVMYVPSIVEKVRMRGTQDLFLVTRVERNREEAHLVSLKPATDLSVDVPFADIFPIGPMDKLAESRLV